MSAEEGQDELGCVERIGASASDEAQLGLAARPLMTKAHDSDELGLAPRWTIIQPLAHDLWTERFTRHLACAAERLPPGQKTALC